MAWTFPPIALSRPQRKARRWAEDHPAPKRAGSPSSAWPPPDPVAGPHQILLDPEGPASLGCRSSRTLYALVAVLDRASETRRRRSVAAEQLFEPFMLDAQRVGRWSRLGTFSSDDWHHPERARPVRDARNRTSSA